jgi:tRNA pseudouridine synthase A
MRYFIEFSYNGTHFFGYQIQPKQISVQEVLEKALSTLLREDIKTTGAGRTDTGVHARKIFAHFDTDQPISADLVKRLNAFLPPSIAIKRIFQVEEEMHARFSAVYRTYEYHISLEKDPFAEAFSWQMWRQKLDVEKMNEACKILFEYEDFTSFSKLHTDVKTNNCKIYHAQWKQKGSSLVFTISANRFLRNMVRAIVGTLVEVGLGKIKPTDLHDIIQAKYRNKAGASAPAHGLYLVDVGYKEMDK